MKKLLLAVSLLLVPAIALAQFPSTSYWNDISSGGWGCINRTKTGFTTDHHTIDSASGTPDPANALKIIFPVGWPDAGEPYHCWNVFGSQQEEIYVQYYFKYSTGYQFHGVDNKQTYYWQGVGSVGNFYITINGSRKVNMVTQTYATARHTSNTGYDPVISSGTWYKLTAYFRMNTPGVSNGICRIWLDDQLVIDKSTIGYRSSSQAGIGFREMTITPVFGGSSGTVKTQTDYQWFDKAIIQATPIGGTSDLTPPYVTDLSPPNGALEVPAGTTSFSFNFRDAVAATTTGLSVDCSGYGGVKSCAGGTLTCSGSGTLFGVTYGDLSLAADNVVSCTIDGRDVAGNALPSLAYSFTVAPAAPPPVQIATTTLPDAVVGTSITVPIVIENGRSPVSCDNTGILPPGIPLNDNCSFGPGIPLAQGAYSFTLTATDADAVQDNQAYVWTVLPATPGGQVTIAIQDNANTYINSGSPGTNYSTSTEMRTYVWPFGQEANILLSQGSTSGLPDNISILRATYRVYQTGYDGAGIDNMVLYVQPVTGSVSLDNVTWANFAGVRGAVVSQKTVGLDNGWKEFDVTAIAQAAYADGKADFQFSVGSGSTGPPDQNRIDASSEHPNEALRPHIVYTYRTLESPGGVVVSGSGKARLGPNSNPKYFQ